MSNHLTVQEAAVELHRLINSRVSSPRIEEIAEIISKAAIPHAAPDASIDAPSPLHAEIARVTAEYRDAWANDSEERVEPLRAQLATLTALLPRTPTVANVAAWAETTLAHACEEQTASGEPVFCTESQAQQAACANLVAAARALVGAPIAAGTSSVVGIAAIEDEITRAQVVRSACDEASVSVWSQKKRGDPDGNLARRHAEITEREHAATERIIALQTLMLRFDPQMPAEVLPLALAFGSELDTFLADAVHAKPALEADAKVLERAHDAIIRGLVFRLGLQSPVLEAHVVHDWHDRPQPDLAEAGEEARHLLAKKLVTLDDVGTEGAHRV